jgi:hypothetical protein
MATAHPHTTDTTHTTHTDPQRAGTVAEAPVRSRAARRALAALRIGFGLTFLWAFVDKLLGLGFATGAITDPDTGARTGIDLMAQDQAWLNGGSPTEGFLAFGSPQPTRSTTPSPRWPGSPGPTGCSWPACSASG